MGYKESDRTVVIYQACRHAHELVILYWLLCSTTFWTLCSVFNTFSVCMLNTEQHRHQLGKRRNLPCGGEGAKAKWPHSGCHLVRVPSETGWDLGPGTLSSSNKIQRNCMGLTIHACAAGANSGPKRNKRPKNPTVIFEVLGAKTECRERKQSRVLCMTPAHNTP